jgi:hypothetical protein
VDHFNWLTGYVRIIFQKKWGLIDPFGPSTLRH